MSSTQTPPTAPAAVVAALFDRVHAIAGELAVAAADGTIDAARGPGMVELTTGLLRDIDRMQSAAVRATASLHLSAELRLEGNVSTKQWLMRAAGMTDKDAIGMLARTRSMDDFPTAWQAWNEGKISGPAAREISVGLTSVYRGKPSAVRAEMPQAEAVLVELASSAGISVVASAIEQLRAVVDTDGMTQSELDAHDDQSLTITAVGSMAVLKGYLSHEGQAMVATAIDQIIEGWYRDGTLTPEDQPTGDEGKDSRHRRARRPHLAALALVELARRQVDNGLLGSRHEVKPHLTVTVDAGDLARGLTGELQVPGESHPVLLPAATIERILCDCDVTDVVTTRETVLALSVAPEGDDTEGGEPLGAVEGPSDGAAISRVPLPGLLQAALGGEGDLSAADLVDWLQRVSRTVLYVGRTRRTVTPRQRIALVVRDRHCAFTGCTVDPSRCDAHHVRYWRNGGGTDLDSLVLLCAAHHRLVHEGGWTIVADRSLDAGSSGYWSFAPPPPRRRP